MLKLSYDLHIHSCLSPCGDDDMTPCNIAAMASLKELDIIAVSDHNSCKNCPAVTTAAENYGLLVIPAMELTTSEEVHALCFFKDLESALSFDGYVYEHLLPIANKENIFGRQLLCNADDEILGSVPNLLINSTDISFDDLPALTEKYDGIVVPAHINKSSTSVLSNLGFIPPDSSFLCAELNQPDALPSLTQSNPYLSICNIITSSDAHTLGDISEPVHFLEVEEKSIHGVLEALCKISR